MLLLKNISYQALNCVLELLKEMKCSNNLMIPLQKKRCYPLPTPTHFRKVKLEIALNGMTWPERTQDPYDQSQLAWN